MRIFSCLFALTSALALTGCGEQQIGYMEPSPISAPAAVSAGKAPAGTTRSLITGAELRRHGALAGIIALNAHKVDIEPREFGPFEVSGVNQLRLHELELTAAISTTLENAGESQNGGLESSLKDWLKKISDDDGKITRIIADAPTLNIYPSLESEVYTRIDAGLLILEFAESSRARLYDVTLSYSDRPGQMYIANADWDMKTMRLTPR